MWITISALFKKSPLKRWKNATDTIFAHYCTYGYIVHAYILMNRLVILSWGWSRRNRKLWKSIIFLLGIFISSEIWSYLSILPILPTIRPVASPRFFRGGRLGHLKAIKLSPQGVRGTEAPDGSEVSFLKRCKLVENSGVRRGVGGFNPPPSEPKKIVVEKWCYFRSFYI